MQAYLMWQKAMLTGNWGVEVKDYQEVREKIFGGWGVMGYAHYFDHADDFYMCIYMSKPFQIVPFRYANFFNYTLIKLLLNIWSLHPPFPNFKFP